jgi:mannosyltransferase
LVDNRIRRDHILLLILLIAGLLLRLLWLGRNELAHDEPFTVYWALRPWSEFMAMLRTENNPPLYFLLMRAWVSWVPLDPAWLRVPSAVFGGLVVWPLLLIARSSGSTVAAWSAGVLVVFSNYHYGYSHEVRAYALFTLLTTASIWQLLRLTEARPRASVWLIVVNILMVYTHFFGWLVVGLQVLFVLLLPAFRPVWRSFLKVLAATALAFLPYAWIFAQRAQTSIASGTWLERPVPEEIYNMIWRWSNAPVIAVALLVLLAVSTIRQRASGTLLRLGLLWTFIPLLGLFLVSWLVPVYLDRYLVFAAPGFALLVGLCISTLPDGKSWKGAVILTVALAVTFTPWQQSHHRPSRVVERVEIWRSEEPCATVLVVPAWYRNTYRFAQDRDRFKDEDPDLMDSHVLEAGYSPCETMILVDASPPDPSSAALKEKIHANHEMLDSLEVSHKVHVIRWRPK